MSSVRPVTVDYKYESTAGIFGALEFLGDWNFWGNVYSYNIYDNSRNQSCTKESLLGWKPPYTMICHFHFFSFLVIC